VVDRREGLGKQPAGSLGSPFSDDGREVALVSGKNEPAIPGARPPARFLPIEHHHPGTVPGQHARGRDPGVSATDDQHIGVIGEGWGGDWERLGFLKPK
jgi:hypothetical protein